MTTDENEQWVDETVEQMEMALDFKKILKVTDTENTELVFDSVVIPAFVLEDAIEKLNRYKVITHNLHFTAYWLWNYVLKKNRFLRNSPGSLSPYVAGQDEAIQSMASIVEPADVANMDYQKAYREIVFQFARLQTGDPTGYSKYLDNEYSLFEQLEEEENG